MSEFQDALGNVLGVARRLLPSGLKASLRGLYQYLPPAWRRSARFRQTLRDLERSERWNTAQVTAYQEEQLRRIIAHAARYVPGYTRRFAEANVTPATFAELSDLERFPFLSKEDLRSLPEKYRAINLFDRELEKVVSGGTTGLPTSFFHERGQFGDVMSACKSVSWERAGYEWGRSPTVDLTASFDGPAANFVESQNTLHCSISALDPKRFPEYADALQKLQPEFLIGFPSTVTLFAKLVTSAKMSLPVRGIIIASEVLYEDQRELLESTFHARIFQWYGLSENAGFAAGCEKSDRYHFFPTMGVVELVDDQGKARYAVGDEGEIVLTGLTTWATPFIRYRTGDRGVWGPSPCPACGRPFKTLERISGRLQEYLVAVNGRTVPHSALNFHDPLLSDVWQHQFSQTMPGHVVLSLVYVQTPPASTLERIRQAMMSRLGSGFTIDIKVVPSIPRTPRGKHKLIDQRIPTVRRAA